MDVQGYTRGWCVRVCGGEEGEGVAVDRTGTGCVWGADAGQLVSPSWKLLKHA